MKQDERTPGLFRKKPVQIEAVEVTAENRDAVIAWIGKDARPWNPLNPIYRGICIETLEGVMTANLGDWVIKGVKGEFYPCKPDIFAATYEPVDSVNAYSTDALRSALERCERAMKPFADRVYNDNYDITVTDTYRLGIEEYTAIYFAHKAARTALSSSPPEGLRGWRDIETAPKDGTEILTFSDRMGLGTMVLYWADGYWREKANGLGLKYEPTHWMPLPVAPDAARTALAGVTAPSEVDAK